jgi:hypothetical protein
MRYRFEYNGNPEYVTVHVDKWLTDKYVSTLVEGDTEGKELMNDINSAKGVDNDVIGSSIHSYSVTVKVAMAFDRLEVLEGVLATIVVWLQAKGIIAENEELVRGEDIRNDIKVMQCPECARIQEEEMRGLC